MLLQVCLNLILVFFADRIVTMNNKMLTFPLQFSVSILGVGSECISEANAVVDLEYIYGLQKPD